MADDELDRIFREHEKKQRESQKREDEKIAQFDKLKSQVSHALMTDVHPVLERVRDNLIEKGHTAQVNDSPEDFSIPRVQLLLQLNEDYAPGVTSGSVLKFEMADGAAIDVSSEIRGRHPGATPGGAAGGGRRPSIPISEVSRKWVHSEALHFIQAVLKAHDRKGSS